MRGVSVVMNTFHTEVGSNSTSRATSQDRSLANSTGARRTMVAPVIPGLTDRDMESILAAARQAGALDAVYTVLRLPREVGDLFRAWLHHHAPEKSARILALLYDLRRGKLDDPRFGSRMTGLGHYGDLLGQRFALAKRRQAFPGLPALNTGLFQAPPAPLQAPAPTPQLDLF